jgi:hypothetical protein
MITKVEAILLTCDGCEAVYTNISDFSIFPDASAAENDAAEEGWVKSGEKHYCPKCS